MSLTKQIIYRKQKVMRALQYKFPGLSWKKRVSIGGSETKGNPREGRPIDTKQALHVVLRSSRARGSHSLLAHVTKVEAALQRQAEHFGIKIYECSTPGNHVHLLLKVRRRKDLGRFLRAVSGILARILLGAEKGLAQLAEGESFWDARPWSRVVFFGKDLRGVRNYLRQNSLEALGLSRLSAKAMVTRVDSLLQAGKLSAPGFV